MAKAKKMKSSKTRSKKLKASDKAQYETERMFAAEHVVQAMLEGGGFVGEFETNEGDEHFGSCELNGVDDARDEDGCGGAWVCVRIYVPNLDIDTEIDR